MLSIWENVLYPLLAFNGTLTVVTALVAFGAFALYKKQRSDSRRDAAGVILREIALAESLIPEVRDAIKDAMANNPIKRTQLMKSDNWDRLQHVIARAIPVDVMENITSFYNAARQLDETMDFIYRSYYENVTEVRRNQFRVIADFMDDVSRQQKDNPNNSQATITKNKKVWDEYLFRKKTFEADYSTATSYIPKKLIDDADEYLKLVPNNLSQTRPGDKLRRAQFTRFHNWWNEGEQN